MSQITVKVVKVVNDKSERAQTAFGVQHKDTQMGLLYFLAKWYV